MIGTALPNLNKLMRLGRSGRAVLYLKALPCKASECPPPRRNRNDHITSFECSIFVFHLPFGKCVHARIHPSPQPNTVFHQIM